MVLSAILALALLQDDVQAHFEKALSFVAQHQDEEAIAEFQRTLELKPGLYEADLNLGILLLRNKRPAEALVVLKQAADAKPKEPRPNLFYAQALLDSGNLVEAEARYRELSNKEGLLAVAAASDKANAIRLYKELGDNARLKLAYLAQADAEPAKAMEYLQQALLLDPNDYDVHMSIGRILRDGRKLIPAANEFFAAAKLKPDSVSAWNELASVLIVGERYAEGLAALDRVRALGKEIPGDLYLRAITLDKLKQKVPALAAYRGFLEADKGAHQDQEFLSRQRIRIIESEMKK